MDTAATRNLAIRPDLQLLEAGVDYNGWPQWTIYDPVQGKYFRANWLIMEILKRHHLTLPEIIASIIRDTPFKSIDESQIHEVYAYCRRANLLRCDSPADAGQIGARSEQRKTLADRIFGLMFIIIPLVNPDRFLNRTIPYLRFLFTRSNLLLSILSIAAVGAIILVIRYWHIYSTTFTYWTEFPGMLYYLVALVATKILHELAHAYVAKYYGVRVPALGIAFIVGIPMLHANTTESWKIASPMKRVRIGIAGVFMELVLAVIATYIWYLAPEGPIKSAAFLISSLNWIITLSINIWPFLRWDGYYVLSDLIKIENLHERAGAFGKWFLRLALFGWVTPQPEEATSGLRIFLICFAYATWIYRAIIYVALVYLVYLFLNPALGYIFLLIGLGRFILRPIYKELAYIFKQKEILYFNMRFALTLTLLCGAAVYIFYPFPEKIHAPAVSVPISHSQLFAKNGGRITHVNAKLGQHYRADELIFKIHSDHLKHQRSLAILSVLKGREELKRFGSRSEFLDQRIIAQERVKQALFSLEKIKKEAEELSVRAAFSGYLRELDPGLHVNSHVSENQLLGVLVGSNQESLVNLYVSETDRGLISVGSKGRFYPSGFATPPSPCVISEIDFIAATEINDDYLLSVAGGGVPVEQNQEGQYIPNQAVYKASCRIELVDAAERRLRGEVIIEGQQRSLAMKVYARIQAMFLNRGIVLKDSFQFWK